jgi:hypothetical protein
MKILTWTQRICIGSGLALVSVFIAPAVTAAAYCPPVCSSQTVNASSVVPPSTGGTPGTTSASSTTIANGSSSLPFTGADVGELAVLGAGAVIVGGVMTRRRRRTAA